MNVLRNKKVLAALAVVAVLLIVASFVAKPKQGTGANAKNDQPKLSDSDKKILKERDKKKQESIYAVMNSINFTYVSQRIDFPQSDQEGWDSILDTVRVTDSFIDPYTNTIYSFVDNDATPDYGQIQYGPGLACENDRRTFKKGYGQQSLAFRAKFSDGVRCFSNFQG
jgi:hypothetical protein